MNNQYFAALPTDQVAGELNKRIDQFYRYYYTNGLLAQLRKSYLAYYGSNAEKSSWQVNSSGDQGELSVLVSNEYRNLVSHLLVLTTQSRPAMDCIATNSDYDSQVQCILGNSLLEYYLRESKLERRLKDAVETALVLNAGFISVTWDTNLGEEVAVDPVSQKAIRNGDIKYQVLTPMDVIYDFTKRSADDNEWYIVREYKNKYDLAAQYPEFADDIKGLSRDKSEELMYRFDNFFYFEGEDSSDIPVYTFYHKSSPALPGGRLVQFVSPKVVLLDTPIPYRKLPIVRIAAGEMIGKSFGYSSAMDLLGLQDVVDGLVSSITTNTTTFGVSNIWIKPGHNLEVSQLAQGMNLFESTEKPEPINFAQFPPELMDFMKFCIGRMETLSGVNSTARGNPPSADTSGAALALIQSMALQFNSGLQQSYVQLLEDVGQLTINHLQDFAHSPRIALIAGKYAAYQARTFTSQDLDGIQRVHVDMGNPLAKTVSGRMTMAQDLLKNNLIHTPEQYLEVMSTGRLEPLIEGEQALLLSIRQENEALSDGKQVPVISIENHKMHIDYHQSLVASPSAKNNPKLVQDVLNHIQDHMNQWRAMDPVLAQVLGIPPLPASPQGPMPQQGMPAPQQQSMPQHMAPKQLHGSRPIPVTAPNPAGVVSNQSPLQQAANKVKQPNMPKNALTKQTWNPQTGGL